MLKECHSCIRILMMVFNFIFVLCGLGLFALGLYFYLATFFKNMGPDGSSMVILFYITMGIGTFTFIVGACGCCGAYHESPCLLGTYFVLLLIIFASEITGGVFCFQYRNQVQDTFEKAFEKGVSELMGKPENKEHWMDEAQRWMTCCGANGPNDYSSKLKTPDSCCDEKCPVTNSSQIIINRKGCKHVWKDIVQNKWMIFAGILLGIIFIELLGLILSMVLCCQTRSADYDMVETRA